MEASRRSVLGASALGAMSMASAAARSEIDRPDPGLAVADLIRRSEQANAALMRGDVDTYLGLIALGYDFTLMSPFGGTPSRGAYSRARWDQIGKFFKNGTLKQELVQAYGTTDMVVLAVIEHGEGEVGGLPHQAWPLRVTLVYRRDGADWKLVHRHADPLARGITLEQSAALARGSEGN